jgi:hypothetical protein
MTIKNDDIEHSRALTIKSSGVFSPLERFVIQTVDFIDNKKS